MAINLGSTPEALRVTLVEDADFYQTLRRADGLNWATGPAIQVILDFGETEWTAMIEGPLLIWHQTSALVNALISTRPREVRLWYIEEGVRVLWGQGDIEVIRGER